MPAVADYLAEAVLKHRVCGRVTLKVWTRKPQTPNPKPKELRKERQAGGLYRELRMQGQGHKTTNPLNPSP